MAEMAGMAHQMAVTAGMVGMAQGLPPALNTIVTNMLEIPTWMPTEAVAGEVATAVMAAALAVWEVVVAVMEARTEFRG